MRTMSRRRVASSSTYRVVGGVNDIGDRMAVGPSGGGGVEVAEDFAYVSEDDKADYVLEAGGVP